MRIPTPHARLRDLHGVERQRLPLCVDGHKPGEPLLALVVGFGLGVLTTLSVGVFVLIVSQPPLPLP